EVIAKHHRFSPLRSAHAAAQQSFFATDKTKAVKEAEAIQRIWPPGLLRRISSKDGAIHTSAPHFEQVRATLSGTT
ncbi:unnamed protein product, partial [marine sediment metagenome]